MPVEAVSASCWRISSVARTRSKLPLRSVRIRSLLWNIDAISSGGFSPGWPPTFAPAMALTFCSLSN